MENGLELPGTFTFERRARSLGPADKVLNCRERDPGRVRKHSLEERSFEEPTEHTGVGLGEAHRTQRHYGLNRAEGLM